MSIIDLMTELVKQNIDFNHRSVNNFSFVYIHGYKDANDYVPYVRVSKHEGDEGFYCRYNGLIKENQSIDDILEMAGELTCFCD